MHGRKQQIVLALAAPLVLGAVGCQHTRSTLLAITGRLDAPQYPSEGKLVAEREQAPSPPRTVVPPPIEEPTREEAFAEVLDDLQEIGATDPGAQQQLLTQLQQVKPSLWPVTVQQFKSTLAYASSLRNDSSPAPVPGSPSMGPEGLSPDSGTRLASRTEESPRPTAPTTPTPKPTNAAPGAGPPEVTIPEEQPIRPVAPTAFPVSYPQTPTSAAWPAQSSPEVTPSFVKRDSAVRPAGFNPPPIPGAVGDDAFLPPTGQRAPGPTDWRDELTEAIARLQSETSSSPDSPEQAYLHARLRLLQLAAGKDDAAVAPVPGLPVHEQSYWSNQLFAISTMLGSDTQPAVSPRATAAGSHLSQAAAELAELSALSLRNLRFCKTVYGYGAYESREAATFSPGEKLLLYVEVENYSTRPSSEGLKTSLASRYRIVNTEGGIVDEHDFPVVDDTCLSRRRDFHIQYEVPLRKGIAPGPYRLEISMEDRFAEKTGKNSIDFVVR